MKKRFVKLVRNKGGRAYIFNFKNVFRLAFLFRNESFTHSLVRFTSLERAENFARQRLNDFRVDLALSHRERESPYPPGGYPVYKREYHRYAVRGHDDLNLSYWYKLGVGRAVRHSVTSKSRWWG